MQNQISRITSEGASSTLSESFPLAHILTNVQSSSAKEHVSEQTGQTTQSADADLVTRASLF